MSFRLLHDQLLDYDGEAAFADVLTTWLRSHTSAVDPLKSVNIRSIKSIPQLSDDESWLLYEAHRVLELLVLRFQSGNADGSEWPGPAITKEEFAQFAQSIGLTVMRPLAWSPFHHEITTLTTVPDPKAAPEVLHEHWPCLMLGSMLFMRAGVAVAAGAHTLAPDIASTSRLYWAHRRKTRPHSDLAHGWGANSSWRTRFRRDYFIDGTFHFNVEGDCDLSALPAGEINEDGLTALERQELVIHRCFVTCKKDDADLFPYGDRYSIKAR